MGQAVQEQATLRPAGYAALIVPKQFLEPPHELIGSGEIRAARVLREKNGGA